MVQNGSCQNTLYTEIESSSDSDTCFSDLSFLSVTPPLASPIMSADDDDDEDVTNSDCEDATELGTSIELTQCLLPSTLTEEPDLTEQLVSSTTHSRVNTYKVLGDNIDFTVKARYNRVDGQKDNQSLHYFHHMCVRDRVNLSHLPIIRCDSCLNSPNNIALQLLPTKISDDKLVDDLAVLVSRVIVSYMPYFQFGFTDVVTWHIEHEFYKEMSEKSEVVSYL